MTLTRHEVVKRLLSVLLIGLMAASAARSQESPQTAAGLKLAAHQSFEAAEPNTARGHLRALQDLYRAEYASDPSWQGEYQWSRRLGEVAHEYLRGGQFSSALTIMGEAADLDVPLRNGFDNGLASTAGGLHRHLAALDGEERYELLHEWSMPTEARQTVRVLESFVPVTAPPAAFARVFGERPRDSSFPIARVGEVSGLFSSAWELVTAADEAGRLRHLTAELEGHAEQQVVGAKHVLTLAQIVGDKGNDEKIKADLTHLLTSLRDDSPRPADRSGVTGFRDAWQYGYGTFDDANARIVDFSPYAVWSGAAWQMRADRPSTNPQFDFLRTDRTGGHPANSYVCIHRWVAPADGVLSATGTMHHPTAQGNGVRGRVVSSRLGLCGQWRVHRSTEKTEIARIEVRAGDTIDFAIDAIGRNTHYDTFVWMVQLRLQTQKGLRIYDSVADFCGPSDAYVLPDAVLAAACLEHSSLQPLAVSIFEKLLQNTCDADSWLNRPHESDSRLIRPVLRRAWATAVAKRSGKAESNLLDNAELGDWVPNSGLTSAQHAQGRARPSWLASDGQLFHLAGPGNDFLFFKYPLTGDFSFSVEAQFGGRPGTNGGVIYGGLIYQIDSSGELLTVSDLEGHNEIVRPCPHDLANPSSMGGYAGQPRFKSLAVGSTAGRVNLATNDQAVWDEPSSVAASPWLALRSLGDCTPVFRNLKITGQPIIPREVLLSEADLLRGWSAGYYGERMPSPLQDLKHLPASFSGARSTGSDVYANYFVPELIANLADDRIAEKRPGGSAINAAGASIDHDWFATDGIIHGSRREPKGDEAVAQSRLYYFRPLLSGETISYEFQYEPGKYEVHPALGRLAFLIEPGGVRLHWMTDGEREWTGLAEDNAVVEPFDRRGPKPLPLAAKDWNRMTVALADDEVTLTLNDHVIYQRELAPGEERTFGFYHDACRSAAQVRNVVLRGDWPEQLSPKQQQALGEVSLANRSVAERQVLNQLLQDRYLAPNSLDIARRARLLPAQQRFDYLAGWVLTGNSRSPIRMHGTFAPLPAPPLENEPMLGAPSPSAFPAVETRRVQIGSQLIAPAMDFVTLAKQMGRLDDLRSRLAAPGSEAAAIAEDKRAHSQRQAFLALVNIADEDFAAADANLIALVEGFEGDDVTETLDRWPEMVALWVALRHPETEEAARELLDVMHELVRAGKLGESEAWKRHLTALAFASNYRRELEAIGQAPIEQPLAQWHTASHVTASSRGQGFPLARWQRLPHRIDNVSGHYCDFLYFQSPLQGDFEVECDVASAFGWRETSLMYGGLWALPWGDLARYGIGTLRDRRHAGTLLVAPKFTNPGPWMRYRIAVQGQWMRVYFNGLLIREQLLSSGQDPWLAIRNQWRRSGAVRDLRITGQPDIPSELNLSLPPGFSGWLQYMDDPAGFNTQWRPYGVGEIIGQRNASPSATGRESLLQYHRPMCEDGTIEYEFYYDPQRSHVHPALGRLALLLQPAGVRVHWVTDGANDRTGLDPVNVFDEPKNRRGPNPLPLVAGDWNKLQLTLTGDTVAIALNDQLVFERELEPTNLRNFGLFHDANQTEARVRNIVWRGDWPRELPRLSEQELADVSTIETLNAKVPELTETIEIDFARQGLPRELLAPGTPDKENLARNVTVQPDGVHVTSKAPAVGSHYSYLGSRFRVGGDFDLTASFDGLSTKAANPDGTASIVWMSAIFESSEDDHVALLRKHEGNGQQRLHVFHKWGPPDQKRQTDRGGVYDGKSGVLRLSRRGEKVYCLMAESETAPFRLLEVVAVAAGDVRLDGFKFLLEARSGAEATIVWKKVSVRAERITEKQVDRFAQLTPDETSGNARYVRVDLPNRTDILTLAEVEVMSGGTNVARGKLATQSSVRHGGTADRAVDGNRNGHYSMGLSTTHTAIDQEPWWEVDLGRGYAIEEVLLWNRTEAGQDRLRGFRLQLLDEQRQLIWEHTPPVQP